MRIKMRLSVVALSLLVVVACCGVQSHAAKPGAQASGESDAVAPEKAQKTKKPGGQEARSDVKFLSSGAITAEHRNRILDDIILSGRTIRDFRSESPDKELVQQVITAGLHAPYVLAAVEKYTDWLPLQQTGGTAEWISPCRPSHGRVGRQILGA